MKYTKTIVLILVSSFILNIIGIFWGLPAQWEGDSQVTQLLDMVKRKSLVPKHLGYGTLHQIILIPPMSLYFVSLVIRGISLNPQNLTNSPEFYTTVFLIGRFVSALFGVASVYSIYLIGKEIKNKKVGLWSALISSIIPGFVVLSHFTRIDIITIFFSNMCIYFFIKYSKFNKTKWLRLSFIFFGLSLSLKWFIPLMNAYLLFFIYISNKKIKFKTIILNSPLIPLFYIFSTPASVFAPTVFFDSLKETLPWFYKRSTIGNLIDLSLDEKFISFAINNSYFLSIPIILLLIVLISCKIKNQLTISLIYFWLLSVVINIMILNFFPYRVILPLVSPISLIIGYNIWRTWKSKFFRFVICTMLLFTLFYTIEVDSLFLNDNRYSASRWIQENIPNQSKIIVFSQSSRYLPTIPSFETFTTLDNIPFTGLVECGSLCYNVSYYEPLVYYLNKSLSEVKFENVSQEFICNENSAYILMNEQNYARHVDSPSYLGSSYERKDQIIAKFYYQLLNEKCGWKIIADFKYKTRLNVAANPVNPRIIILKQFK